MKVRLGTSGFSYPEWKGPFYPSDLPQSKMLSFYAGELNTVEINNTFYRLPKRETLEKWASEVPDDFIFSLKASRKITHVNRLKDSSDLVDYLFDTVSVLGDKLGPILVQLPPYLRKGEDRLRTFLDGLPAGRRVTFEFRHKSWEDEAVLSLLRERNVALCCTDPTVFDVACHATADWGYLRLRRIDYDDDTLKSWVAKIKALAWTEVYVYFKHEDEAEGPRFAKRFQTLFDGSP